MLLNNSFKISTPELLFSFRTEGEISYQEIGVLLLQLSIFHLPQQSKMSAFILWNSPHRYVSTEKIQKNFKERYLLYCMSGRIMSDLRAGAVWTELRAVGFDLLV